MMNGSAAELLRRISMGVWGIVAGLAFCLYTLLLGVAVIPMIAVVAARGVLGIEPPRRARVRTVPLRRLDGLLPDRRVHAGR